MHPTRPIRNSSTRWRDQCMPERSPVRHVHNCEPRFAAGHLAVLPCRNEPGERGFYFHGGPAPRFTSHPFTGHHVAYWEGFPLGRHGNRRAVAKHTRLHQQSYTGRTIYTPLQGLLFESMEGYTGGTRIRPWLGREAGIDHMWSSNGARRRGGNASLTGSGGPEFMPLTMMHEQVARLGGRDRLGT